MHVLARRATLTGGIAAIAVVLLPPLSRDAELLFSFHMVQHLLLIAVAAPLLAISGYFQRFSIIRKLVQPVPAWIAFVSIFLFWHWSAAFQWAARNEASQLLEYASILLSAFLFWSVALSAQSQTWFSYGARALFVMTAAVAIDLPGVIMVFSPRIICTMPGENTVRWGLTPLQDQQIAGLLMWVPANLVFFAIATWLFARWISDTPNAAHLVTL
jgi:cytochrome c oxidase assembly factor CtaG